LGGWNAHAAEAKFVFVIAVWLPMSQPAGWDMEATGENVRSNRKNRLARPNKRGSVFSKSVSVVCNSASASVMHHPAPPTARAFLIACARHGSGAASAVDGGCALSRAINASSKAALVVSN
jgi:hypothetical protein